jgi:serine/threonine protein kinase
MSRSLISNGADHQERFLGFGVTGEVVQRGERALKMPRRYDTTNMTQARRHELEWLMEVSCEKIITEMQVYQHLGSYEGIITASYKLPVGTDNDAPIIEKFEPVISMPYMKNGTLQEYISKKEPNENLQIMWTRSLAATVAYCHSKNVILADIGSRNCLLADDLSLKLCDFGDSTIIPPDLKMAEVNDNGVSVRTDIAQFGSVVFEIFTRINLSDPRRPRLHFVEDQIQDINHSDESEDDEGNAGDGNGRGNARADNTECDDYQKSKWPRIEDLPRTEGIRFGAIIYKCWTRAYQDMNQVLRDLTDYEG